MRVAYITAGSAGMICGSCLRDNALANALLGMGCDISLIPTYTPVRSEGQDASMNRVFLGGINVYLQQRFRLFRKLPTFLDRPLDYPQLLNWVASRGIETAAPMLGDLTVSMLRGVQGNQAKEVFRLVNFLKSVRPEIVNLTNVLIGGVIPKIKSDIGVPVVVTLQGDDLFLEQLSQKCRSRALELISEIVPHVDGFIAFNRYYRDHMSSFLGIPKDRIYCLPLGADLEGFPTALSPRKDEASRRIGYLARICPEKGYGELVDAFIQLKQLPDMSDVVLDTAGWMDPSSPGFLKEQQDKIDRAGLREFFRYRGVLDRKRKINFLQKLTIFSVPSIYREPKGIYVLEALASGVPVVQPNHGAFPELLRRTGGGVLARPKDTSSLVQAMARLLRSPSQVELLGKKGHRSVHQHLTAQKMAEKTLQLYCHIKDEHDRFADCQL